MKETEGSGQRKHRTQKRTPCNAQAEPKNGVRKDSVFILGSCKSGVDEEIKINSETLGHGTEECAMSFVIETDHSVSYKKDSDLE